MKIALVCDWYRPRVGGIELHLEDLANRLIQLGHEVVVITATPGDTPIAGVRVRRIDAPRAPHFGFLTTPAGVRAVGRAIAEERPDIAHCHVSIVSPTALGGASHAIAQRIPTVLTFHSIVPQTPLLARAMRTLLGTAKWPAVFTAVSERVANEVRPIAAAATIRILPNGVDAAWWRAQSPSRPVAQSSIRLLSVMRLNPKKRPLAFVPIVRRLAAHDVRLRIVGDGPHFTKLSRAIARAGLGRRIELLGRRTREEIRQLVCDSDLFVLPTARESFGLAALEARCAGVPVVAMARSGVAEFIEHGHDGLLAQSDDEIAAHIAGLAGDRARLRALSEAARNTPVPHDWPRVIDAHLAAYRDAIAVRATV